MPVSTIASRNYSRRSAIERRSLRMGLSDVRLALSLGGRSLHSWCLRGACAALSLVPANQQNCAGAFTVFRNLHASGSNPWQVSHARFGRLRADPKKDLLEEERPQRRMSLTAVAPITPPSPGELYRRGPAGPSSRSFRCKSRRGRPAPRWLSSLIIGRSCPESSPETPSVCRLRPKDRSSPPSIPRWSSGTGARRCRLRPRVGGWPTWGSA